MDILLLMKAFILGVVEGATEFLPISSTGHLIIVGDYLHFNDDKGKVFEIVIQLAAILAVCWEYRRKLIDTALHLGSESQAQQFVLNLFLAFLPAAILGLALHSTIKEYLFSPITVAVALIVGGFAILWIERLALTATTVHIDKIGPKQAVQIGLAQSLALFPGVSRAWIEKPPPNFPSSWPSLLCLPPPFWMSTKAATFYPSTMLGCLPWVLSRPF
jgi:undecaprenyl-diphosphatase